MDGLDIPEGRSPEIKNAFLCILSKLLPSPHFGQLVQLFSYVESQDLNVSLGLRILYTQYMTGSQMLEVGCNLPAKL